MTHLVHVGCCYAGLGVDELYFLNEVGDAVLTGQTVRSQGRFNVNFDGFAFEVCWYVLFPQGGANKRQPVDFPASPLLTAYRIGPLLVLPPQLVGKYGPLDGEPF